MARLLEKIRTLRARHRTANQRQRKHQPTNHRVWPYYVVGFVLLLAAYFWFSSARLLKEPIRVDYGPGTAAFATSIGPIVGAEFLGGNKVETLVNGDEFFPSMLRAIAEAKKSITLETYIWSSGYISNKFIDALSERAHAGVKVNVIVDGMGTLHLAHSDRERMQQAGIEIYGYGREHWYDIKPNINHRTHRKLLIIDGKIGFTGGMCIDDKWLGHADHKEVWRETQVRIEGPVVREMQAVFAQNWLQTTSGLLLGDAYYPTLEKTGGSFAQCYRSGPSEGPQYARLGYLFAIASARHTIDITHAYFVPDQLAVDMLVEARARGVRVRVIVPAINDSRMGRAASRSRWGELLKAGVEFYRYEPAMLHAKTMIVDDTMVTVGSANFDNRSFAINDEVAVNIIDPDVARKHRKIFEDDLEHSERYTLQDYESRPFYVKAADKFCGLFRSQF